MASREHSRPTASSAQPTEKNITSIVCALAHALSREKREGVLPSIRRDLKEAVELALDSHSPPPKTSKKKRVDRGRAGESRQAATGQHRGVRFDRRRSAVSGSDGRR